MSGLPFPGGTAVTDLRVYDTPSPDGCRGGTPHLHTASSEGYVVLAGSGAVHTLSAAGIEEHALAAGDVVWFAPGTVHRLVNDGDLRLLVVMSNAGLPEAGDAVMTFPVDVLDDPDAYARAAALPVGASVDETAAAVRARRDLALRGYLELRAAVADAGPSALADLHSRAARLVQPRVAQWESLWEATVARETERTRAQLDALAEGAPGLLAEARVARAAPRADSRTFGMCGRLHAWHGEGER